MHRTARLPAIVVLALAGCRTPAPVTPPAPPGSPPPLELPLGTAPPFGVDGMPLPTVDAKQVKAESVAPGPGEVRPITEEQCRRESAARSSLAALTPIDQSKRCPGLRDYLVAADRNRVAAKALGEFYQLADAEGRAAIARDSLPILDELRAGVAAAKAQGVAVPLDAGDLDRQRATLLASLNQAELGANLLDIDLKRRAGVPGRISGRLRPTGPFPPVATAPADRDALVQTALETRGDLRLLRAAAIDLSPETLPDVRALLKESNADPLPLRIAKKQACRAGVADSPEEIAAEMAVRRAQLMELISQRERQAADEVRAAALGIDAQVTQVALARWRVEALQAKLNAGPDAGPLARRVAELEIARARADLVVAVATYHQNRIKLLAAMGLLGGG